MKRNQALLLISLVIAICIGITLLFFSKKDNHTHFHAGFFVYINGQLQDYTDQQYMYFDVCSVLANQDERSLNDQDKIHLHNQVGDVAHIHYDGVTWGLLFKNMNITFDSNLPITGYSNGKKVESILSKMVKANDSVIIVVGSENNVDINKYVT